ncbi:MAG: hypothetical protein Q8S73_20330 [Deltaproteobacteria bacterium]|nr:hypothetical protein [Myxococcales bacterium]MDP3216467.1 hypothetical protein [Deltaproteobacteria bacterium]
MGTYEGLMVGAHRGGLNIARWLSREGSEGLGRRVAVADPVAGRAQFLARALGGRTAGAEVRAFEQPGAALLPTLDSNGTMVLASDTPSSLAEVLDQRGSAQQAAWQIAGRAPGGAGAAVFALRGTVLRGDGESAWASAALLGALARVAPPQSSRVITAQDALAAVVLAPLRDRVSRQTARHLATLERDPWDLDGTPLSIVQGEVPQPLRVVAGEDGARWRAVRERALGEAGEVPAGRWSDAGAEGRYLVVAVVVALARVEFVTVRATRSDRRSVAGVLTVDSPPEPERATSAAVMTD